MPDLVYWYKLESAGWLSSQSLVSHLDRTAIRAPRHQLSCFSCSLPSSAATDEMLLPGCLSSFSNRCTAGHQSTLEKLGADRKMHLGLPSFHVSMCWHASMLPEHACSCCNAWTSLVTLVPQAQVLVIRGYLVLSGLHHASRATCSCKLVGLFCIPNRDRSIARSTSLFDVSICLTALEVCVYPDQRPWDHEALLPATAQSQ